jgi:TRAP-type mannitol/chloroaromatic compound transport system permease small subunit
LRKCIVARTIEPCEGCLHIEMKLLNALSTAIDALNRRVGRSLVWLVLASVLISAGNAISRKAFDLSSNAWLEAQWYLYAAAFLGASGYVLMVDEHVRIDAVAQRFSPRLRAWLDIVALLLFVLPLCGLMVTLGGAFTWRAWEIGEMSYNAGGLVRWPVYACIPVGFGLLALQAVSELIKRVGFLRGERERATTSEADLPPIMSGHAAAQPPAERL